MDTPKRVKKAATYRQRNDRQIKDSLTKLKDKFQQIQFNLRLTLEIFVLHDTALQLE
jgi:hypothetical protein